MIYFISDLHFGHANIMRHDGRKFNSVEDMDAALIRNWNNKVTKEDAVYILGDIGWYRDEEMSNILKRLNGKKILIKGNHDKIGPNIRRCFEYVKDYEEIKLDGKKVVLCHYPIMFYNGQHHDSIMLYGHVHNTREESIMQSFKAELKKHNIPCNIYNTGCMLHDFEPKTLEEIINDESQVLSKCRRD